MSLQGIKEFPFKESQLLKMLVTNFSHCKNYGEGVTAAEYINQAFNGQKGFRDGNCEACCDDNATKKCSSCESLYPMKLKQIRVLKLCLLKTK